MPAVPSCILEPLREHFLTLLPFRHSVHPLGCHRPRIDDAVVFDAYDKLIGLDLADLAVDGCTTKAPCGGECAGRSPVDRGKGGLKRSQLTDGAGIPIVTVSAPANIVDHTLRSVTLDAIKDFQPLPAWVTVHLDADGHPCRDALAEEPLAEQWRPGTVIDVGGSTRYKRPGHRPIPRGHHGERATDTGCHSEQG